MPTDLATLGLDNLTVQERLDLIESLWDSLPDHVDANTVPDWHLAEIAKRHAHAKANPGAGKPWREVLASLEANSPVDQSRTIRAHRQ